MALVPLSQIEAFEAAWISHGSVATPIGEDRIVVFAELHRRFHIEGATATDPAAVEAKLAAPGTIYPLA